MSTLRIKTPRSALTAAQLVALLAVPLVTLAGCDLFSGGRTYSGVVVDADTGLPVEGIHMSLRTSGGGVGGYVIIEGVFTDRDGEFRLQTERHDADVYANSPGYGGDDLYRPEYGSAGPIFYRDRDNIRVELQPRTPL